MMFQFLTIKQLCLVVCHLSRQRLDTSSTANDKVLFDSVYLISLRVLHTFDTQPKHFEFVNTHFPPFLVYPLPHHEPDESGLLAWTGKGSVPA